MITPPHATRPDHDEPSVQVVTLARRPEGVPVPADFALAREAARALGPGEARVAVLDLSLDPYLRSLLGSGHLADAATAIGGVVPATSVAQVTEIGASDGAAHSLAVGDLVLADTGWRTEAVLPIPGLRAVRVPEEIPASAALGALGMPGLTAYAAHTRHVSPKPGETVVVTAATGGVGSVAGALAKAAGARTVAVVGTREKAELATTRLGYDAAVVRSEPTWLEQLHAACPDRINGYFHMADQAVLDGVVEHLALGARVSLIGVIDQNNGAAPTRMRVGAVMGARAHVQGMVVYDHTDLVGEQIEAVSALIRDGRLPLLEDRSVGLEQAPQAFSRLLSGRNVGKVIVEVSSARAQGAQS